MTKRKDDSRYNKLEQRATALEQAQRGFAASNVSSDVMVRQDACRNLCDLFAHVKSGGQLYNKKIALIKIIRALTNCGLMEAKTLVENQIL